MKEKLYRSTKDKVVGGVAAGLGNYLNIDPVIVRIIFVLLTIFNGVGLLVYIIMWIIIPADKDDRPILNFNKDQKINNFDAVNIDGQPNPDNSKTNETTNSQAQNNTININEETKSDKVSTGRLIFGGLLVFFGLAFFLEKFFDWFDFHDLIPLVFIIVGLLLLWNSIRK
ncbi:MAG TPA: PspC domain-containing protein [Melioribacteraceae bacterium]|nr:PspC domain-containing protein [Melioribacteraceae bacterium]